MIWLCFCLNIKELPSKKLGEKQDANCSQHHVLMCSIRFLSQLSQQKFHPTKFSNKSAWPKASSTLYTSFFSCFSNPIIQSFHVVPCCLHALKLPSIPGTVDVVNPSSAQRSSTDIIPGHRRENFQFLSTWLKMDHGHPWPSMAVERLIRTIRTSQPNPYIFC